jgi:hypothetical protein
MLNPNQTSLPVEQHLAKSNTALSRDEVTVLLLADMFGSEYAKRSASRNGFEAGRIAPLLENNTRGWINEQS